MRAHVAAVKGSDTMQKCMGLEIGVFLMNRTRPGEQVVLMEQLSLDLDLWLEYI